jgi:hypothetical protein
MTTETYKCDHLLVFCFNSPQNMFALCVVIYTLQANASSYTLQPKIKPSHTTNTNVHFPFEEQTNTTTDTLDVLRVLRHVNMCPLVNNYRRFGAAQCQAGAVISCKILLKRRRQPRRGLRSRIMMMMITTTATTRAKPVSLQLTEVEWWWWQPPCALSQLVFS